MLAEDKTNEKQSDSTSLLKTAEKYKEIPQSCDKLLLALQKHYYRTTRVTACMPCAEYAMTSCMSVSLSVTRRYYITRKLCYRKVDRAMRAI